MDNQELVKQKILDLILSPKAKERLSNIKLVRPQTAKKIEEYLVYLYQANKLRRKITEKEMIEILKSITNKKEGRVKIIRK